MLSACGSAGSGGGGSGEWLGLAAAVLWAGAREVVATAWPIWDLPFTRDFDLRLADALRSPDSAAASLRKLQLECLAQWRASTHDLTSDRNLPPHLHSHAFPLVWAAYQVVGVC
ncbi:CHAT domain-containing protein [Kribbella ginsengisoli]|uniref:CHAT domain-containing protein n=1 Tax=Kribbella ginsengisoli TaxID=363865 RepID=UPI003CD0BC66